MTNVRSFHALYKKVRGGRVGCRRRLYAVGVRHQAQAV
jgi:hypothetical protein